jgi:hypothetical protein
MKAYGVVPPGFGARPDPSGHFLLIPGDKKNKFIFQPMTRNVINKIK